MHMEKQQKRETDNRMRQKGKRDAMLDETDMKEEGKGQRGATKVAYQVNRGGGCETAVYVVFEI